MVSHLAFCAAPDIDSISPLALRPGVPGELKFSGNDLSEATNVWASFPAKLESLGEGAFHITPLASHPVGIGAVRLFGSNGVSPVALVMLDDLPTASESSTNKTREAAQRVEFGSAIDARCEELSYDWFKVRVNKGQRVAVEVVAMRLGSRLDSVLRVVNAAGRELARNDDVPGLRADSFLTFTALDTGDYFVEVRDVNYGGGSEFFYHLRIGDFPLATAAFPVAAEQGSKHSFRLAGPSGDIGGMVATATTNSAVVPLAIKGPVGSTFAAALTSATREIVEVEPNDTAKKATEVSLETGVNGRFDRANDRDCYEFSARKGDRMEFRAATRSLGAPCDLLMQLESTDGQRLGRSNPSAADEGVLTHAFASNGVYRLIVEEAIGAFGPNMVYRIASRRAAGFALSLDTDTFNAAPGKDVDLKVTVTRGDYKGAVTLALDGLAGALVLTNNVIAEGKSNVTMKVTVPETFLPGTWTPFGVTGTAKRNGQEVRVRASTAPALRKRWQLMLYPLAEFDGVLALGVTAPK
ncbi:MAG TPA: PPC domain-containing protein [Candidatus Limnocylindria bacterium]|nr:PPC domain-containing protein [Candidatus Limnocylindria bacterium]